jgi:RNA polymerase sigma-70 factor (ECF subfamily)
MNQAMDVDVRQCVRGDKAAWDALVGAYAGLIYDAVVRVLRARGVGAARDMIDDAVQDVYLRLVKDDFRLLRTFDPQRASLGTFLTVVARSTTLDGLRKRKAPALPLDEAVWQAPAPEGADPAYAAEHASAGALADLPADLLSPRQKLVLTLMFDRGLDVAEIARFLAVDEQTVRSTKHKGLEKLRRALEAPGGG